MSSPRYLSGAVWSGANACAAVLLPLAIYVFFARTVPQELIGTVALFVSCIEILKTLALPGLYEALLQQEQDQTRCHETASLILLGSAIALFLAYLIGLAGAAFIVVPLGHHFVALAFLGLRVIFDLAALQPQARLAQRLSFRRLAARGMVGNCAGGLMGGLGAFLIDPFAGLIIYQVSQSLMILLMTILGTGSMARPRFHAECFARMRREATLATGVRLLAATINNLDQIIVAALTGSVPLAYYNLGKRIETTFVTAAGSFVAILFQPVFAGARAGARREAFDRGLAVLTIVLGFPAAAFVPNSTFLVTTVFGDQWSGAAAVAAVLAGSGFIRAIGFVPGALMSVAARNRELLITSLTSAVTGAVLVATTAPFGVVWCAVALLVKNAGVVGWMAILLRDEIGRPARLYWTSLLAPFLLMLCGTVAGRLLVGDASAGAGILGHVAQLLKSIAPGAAMGAAYFGFHFRQHVSLYYASLLRRLTARA